MTSVHSFKARCCIVGGGPAGMMLGYLLARSGVPVVVLEKHADSLRDLRGDTVHPSTLGGMMSCEDTGAGATDAETADRCHRLMQRKSRNPGSGWTRADKETHPGPKWRRKGILLASFLLGLVGCQKLAPFVPTPLPVVDRMLELAEVTKDDVVYDLGSGDGRIVITAAEKYGAKAVGIEIDPDLVQKSRQAALRAEVDHLVRIRQQDLLKADFSDATVVTLYLGPNANLRLKPILQRQLKPGARIVSNDFHMEGWEPEVEEEIYAEDVPFTLYLWRVTDPRRSPIR